MNWPEVQAIEGRLLEVEQEVRALRGRLAAATRCTCPAGFGAEADANCPQHSGA